MAILTKDKPVKRKDRRDESPDFTNLQRILPGSIEMEALLAVGYRMDRKKAEAIISEREKNSLAYPYDKYEDALAYMEALNASPRAIDTDPGWSRED